MWSLIGIDGITWINLPHRLHPTSIYIITWFFSTIANIANRDQVSTYISQVTGNHLTSTELSIYSILDLHRVQCIYFWTRRLYASSVYKLLLQPNASNIKNSSRYFIKHGRLIMFGACLLDRPRVSDQDTRVAPPEHVLLLREPPAMGSPTGSPLLWVWTPAVSLPPPILYVWVHG